MTVALLSGLPEAWGWGPLAGTLDSGFRYELSWANGETIPREHEDLILKVSVALLPSYRMNS